MKTILWLEDVEDHNYEAAASYLSLVLEPNKVEALLFQLKKEPIIQYKAKDLFRASQLHLLSVSNFHVKRDRHKIKRGTALSPLLLYRDVTHGKVVIADGFHRLCAVYALNEDALIPCKIA